MARLHDLPNEIIELIVRQLPNRRKIRFGLTCREIWNIAKPEIYRSITIDTDDPNSAFSVFLAAVRHGDLIKELTIVLEAPMCNYRWEKCESCDGSLEDDSRWEASTSPALALIRGTSPARTPNLKELNIKFPKDYGGHHLIWDDDDYDRGDASIIHKSAARMEALLGAVIDRPDSTITILTISNLPSILLQVCDTTRWFAFTSQIQRFELSVSGHGSDDGGYTTNMSNRLGNFLESLELVCKHLKSVTHLKLGFSPKCVVGHQSGTNQAPLHLGNGSMPNLTNLELENMVVDHPLLEFLEHRPANSPALSLTLRNAMCYTNDNDAEYLDVYEDANDMPESLQWKEAFQRMTKLLNDRKVPVIKTFSATFLDVTKYLNYPRYGRPSNPEAMAALNKLAANQPDRILFPYIRLDQETAYLKGEESDMKAAFLAGEDQAAYDEFIERLAQCGDQ